MTLPTGLEKNPLRSGETGLPTEITVPGSRVMWHVLRFGEVLPDPVRYSVIPTDKPEAPVYTDGFYPANIGSSGNPLILELRHEPISLPVSHILPDWKPTTGTDVRTRIALLMTNERDPNVDLPLLGAELLRRVDERGIQFDAVIAPEALGSKLSIAVSQAAFAQDKSRRFYATSLQKGKVRVNPDNSISVGPPKEWIPDSFGIETSSGTSHPAARQKLFLDPKIAEVMIKAKMRVLLVDDARLTQGTITASLSLMEKIGIEVAGIATVLNEGDPVDAINGIPFVYLTKLPLFAPDAHGMRPIPGTYTGLKEFYVRK